MINGKALNARSGKRATAIAAVMLLGAWCGPAIGSSGIDMHCSEATSALENPLASILTSHTESALRDIVDDTTLATLPALTDTANDALIEEVEETEPAGEPAASRAGTPAITTRLPGVPESSLPSFRRQMHRTDI